MTEQQGKKGNESTEANPNTSDTVVKHEPTPSFSPGESLTAFLASPKKKPSPPKETAPTKATQPTDAEAAAPPAEAKAEPKPDQSASEKPKEQAKEPEKKKDADKGGGETVETLQKRLKDTRDAYTQERQRNKELDAQLKHLSEQLDVISKKVDGTFEEPTPEQQQAIVESQRKLYQAKVAASQDAAIELEMARQGIERAEANKYVQDQIWANDGPYMKLEKANPEIAKRVGEASLPVVEALRVLREYEATQGRSSVPDTTETRAAIAAELKKELRAELLKELKGELKFEPVRGHSPSTGEVKEVPTKQSEDKFSSLFPNFQKTHG